MPGRRGLAELNVQPHAAWVQGFDHPLAAVPAQQPHPQAVAHLGAQHLADVHGAVIPHLGNRICDPVDLAEQNDVHQLSLEAFRKQSST